MAETDRRLHFGAGDFTERVTITRRVAAPGAQPGRERGPFQPVVERWAVWRFMGAKAVVEGGRSTDAAEGRMVLRADPETKLITHADRVLWGALDCAIISVAPATRDWPYIELFINRSKGGAS